MPPLRKLGVFEIDAFFPARDHAELALKLNALVASPAFAAWGEGGRSIPSRCSSPPTASPAAAIVYPRTSPRRSGCSWPRSSSRSS